MKKLLALVLALVMTLSLCVTSNAAYTDAADVDYDEAVDVLTAIGVFQGSDGKFDPKANLTREQAAKLVAYLQLGQKAADALVGSGKFTDVAKTAWSAGYVDYCASTGIVNGVGGGLFNPAGSLTALQFGKMLLGCLGYDAKAEGLTGADWEINVSKLMSSADLLKGLDEVSAYSVVTREQAAKMMLNALMAPMVEYANKATSISVNGADIEFGGSNASYVTGNDASKNNIKADQTNDSKSILELAEKLYPKLVLDDDEGVLGRPANKWTYKNELIGTYASDDAVFTYTKDMSSTANKSEMTKALKNYDLSGAVVYKNGWISGDTDNDGVEDAGETFEAVTVAKIAEWTGNGILVEIYADGTDVTRVVVNKSYLAKVTKVNDTDETVTFALDSDSTEKFISSDNYDKFAKDDMVMITPYFSAANTFDNSEDVLAVAAEKVTGKVTGATGTKVTLDGTAYTVAEINSYSQPSLKAETDVLLDAYGYAVKVTNVAAKDFLYAVASYVTKDSYGVASPYAQFVTTAGEVKEYKLAKVGSNTPGIATDGSGNQTVTNGPTAGTLYSYSVTNNKVTLTAADVANASNKHYVTYADDQDITSSTKALTLKTSGETSRFFADDTVFISVTGTLGDLKVSVNTGKQLVKSDNTTPGTAEADYAIITASETKSSSNADIAVVFCNTSAISNAADLIYVKSASPVGYEELKDTEYSTYEVYVNGEKKTIAIDIAAGSIAAKKLYTYGLNDDGAYVLTEKQSNYISDEDIVSIYKNNITVDDTPTDAALTAADAKIVDLTDNGVEDMADLKALVDVEGATVNVTVAFNSDDEASIIYVISATLPMTTSGSTTYTLTTDSTEGNTTFNLSDLVSISYKVGGVTKVTNTVSFTESGAVTDIKVSTVDGWTFTCTP